MSDALPHTHPAVLAVALDWYAATLEADPEAGAPAVAYTRWPANAESGFTPSAWHECDNCHYGRVRKGTCPTCKGKGGWSYDPYDAKQRPIATVASDATRAMTRHELGLTMTVGDYDPDLTGREPGPLRELEPAAPPALRRLEESLAWMRARFPMERGVLVCVHILRVPIGSPDLYADALVLLGERLGKRFRAPGWAREAARRRVFLAL